MHDAAPGMRPVQLLLRPADLLAIGLVLAFGVGLRLLYFSGLGLGDDVLLRLDIAALVRTGRPNISPTVYRFSWWLPSTLIARWLGLGEAGLITPILLFDAAGIVVVYLVAKTLWDRTAGILAALLVVATPLDFAWSTMLTTDVVLSVFAALTLLFATRALEEVDPTWQRRDWLFAAICLWLAYHAKLSALFLLPVIVCICWAERDRLTGTVGTFIVATAVLLGGTFVVTYILSGDPLFAYHLEMKLQGLTGVDAKGHPATLPHILLFGKWLFWPIWTGSFLFSFYPHVLVLLVLLGFFFGVRPRAVPVWWFVFMFLGMTFNVQRSEGMWVAGFRNVRHAHVFVYPIALLVTGYLVAWSARHRPSATAVAVALIAVGLWQSITTARLTHVTFGDMRHAVQFLATLPPKPVYSDSQLGIWLGFAGMDEKGWTIQALVRPTPEERRETLATVKTGYLVTGGGREPYYGCTSCIPRADEVPADRWTLLKEFPDPVPPSSLRPEPLRIWERNDLP
ncbi:MAG: glycosyltransferase family 39 protein [Actinobacteria bacterium]|nr:MAG: glycosyltransferase family 39 protein [Actinomycetota bacterium]